MLPFVSVDAATGTGPGLSRDLEDSVAHHTMLITTTGNPTSVSVILEGSHDGTVWRALVTSGSQPTAFAWSATHVVRHVRANVSQLAGGTSPTVTVTIASV